MRDSCWTLSVEIPMLRYTPKLHQICSNHMNPSPLTQRTAATSRAGGVSVRKTWDLSLSLFFIPTGDQITARRRRPSWWRWRAGAYICGTGRR